MFLPSRAGYIILAALAGVLLALGGLYAVHAAPGQGMGNSRVTMPATPLPDNPALDSPVISLIQSPVPSCVLPRRGTDLCYLTWSYLYAASDPNYMISMTVQIDERIRARYGGFFQTSMYVPEEMLYFPVSCGIPGASGDPEWGLSHSYILRARDSANQIAANNGSVYCPADQVSILSAAVSGPEKGYAWQTYIFTASVTPITTTLPITYTWEVSGFPSQVDVNGLTQSRSYSWTSYGPKTVQFTASNPISSYTYEHTIFIGPYQFHLPLLHK